MKISNRIFLGITTYIMLGFIFNGLVYGQTGDNLQSTSNQRTIDFQLADGSIMKLVAADDVDGDGIVNELEVNGYFWDSDSFKIKAWDGDENKVHFFTDPLQASSDQDPYSDYTEVSGVGLDVNVLPPDNHPLVAARPIINVLMKEYEVIPLATISDATGGSQGTAYTNETSNSTTVGVEVTEGVEIGTGGFNANVSVTGSYSETHTETYSSTSSSEINWSNTRSTQPDKAARIEMILYLENTGSAEALDIVVTVNLKLGDKIIATFNLPMVDALNPGQISADFNVANANGGEITLTLNELRSLQLRAPLTLEVNQVQANVETLDNNNNSIVKSWNNFSGDINAVSVDIVANLGDGVTKRHQVFAATNQWNPQYTLQDLLSRIFNVENTNGGLMIEGRKYPDQWYISSPSTQVINEWENEGRPDDIMPFTMYKNTKIVMNSPGSDSKPKINLSGYARLPEDESSYSRVLVSAVPNNFPISLVTAEVSFNGQQMLDTLHLNESGFYTNSNAYNGVPDGVGKVYVRNARGDVSQASINIPAIYKDASEVKKFSKFIPNPGAEYWIYHEGDDSKPMLVYCQFYDRESGDSLEAPLEYLTLKQDGENKNYATWAHDGNTNVYYFDKVRFDTHDLTLNGKDTSYVSHDFMYYTPIFLQFDDHGLFGKILYNPAFDTLRANINLKGTPLYLSPDTKFTEGPEEMYRISPDRKVTDMYIIPGNYALEGPTGIIDSIIQLNYGNYQSVRDNEMPGNALELNTSSSDGYVSAGEDSSLVLNDQFTIEAWIYPTGPGVDPEYGGIIINKEGEYEIARFADGTIRYALGPSWQWISTGYVAKENAWTHIALVNNLPGSNRSFLYIHDYYGFQYKGLFTKYEITDFFPDSNIVGIGGRQSIDSHKFNGMIDELRVWNIARNKEQIESTLGGVLSSDYYSSADSGLVGYWKFDELEDLGVGDPGVNDVRDYSVFGNHGDLQGDAKLTNGLPVEVEDDESQLPTEFSLSQNYPNPFNPSTMINYQLPKNAFVKLTIYNLLGEQVAKLVTAQQSAGEYSVNFDASNLASGIYIYNLSAGDFNKSRKMLVIK